MFEYKGNKFAKLCCDCVAENHAPYDVLFLFGPHECGKTAMMRYLEDKAYSIGKVSTSYTNANALIDGRMDMDSFISQDSDILMLDDCHLLEKEDFLLDLLGRGMTHLSWKKKKLVLASAKPLSDFVNKSSCNSFFEKMNWEMTAKLNCPTREDCLKALNETARKANLLEIPNICDLFNMLLDAEGNNLGNLLSSFGRIVARAAMAKKDITSEFAKSVIYGDSEIELII